jgi:hypothetical protein
MESLTVTGLKSFEVAGLKIECRPWSMRQLMAFITKTESKMSFAELYKWAYSVTHEGVVSVDGKTGDEAKNLLDELAPEECWSLCTQRYGACSLHAEDKKKSDASP